MKKDNHPRHIQITGRHIRCDTIDDRELLAQAKSIAEDPSAAAGISLANLYAIRDTCQRYALGRAQRASKIAIDTRSPTGPR
ncbi:hypothetical protein [Lacipirellula parvula]|uniref:hypothetical protein n=1 Tax=Lacipirellula parvula TaxID=2650471 RepID=UPI001260457B|nr:hypothetical protein [Lacipirellula parvula]